MIENLNKENFWNGLHEKYPEAVNHFCKWIDDYKKEVKWDDLFASDKYEECKIKFHDLPFEMQNGIIARYELELYNNKQGRGKNEYERIATDFKVSLAYIFHDLQSNIDKRKIKLT